MLNCLRACSSIARVALIRTLSANCTRINKQRYPSMQHARLLVNTQAPLRRTRQVVTKACSPARLCEGNNPVSYLSILKKVLPLLYSPQFDTFAGLLLPVTSTNQRRAPLSEAPTGGAFPNAACPIRMLQKVQRTNHSPVLLQEPTRISQQPACPHNIIQYNIM